MKTNLLLLLLVSVTLTYGQNSITTILNKEITTLLQKDGILLTDSQKACNNDCRPQSPWKNNSQKEKELKKDKKLETLLLAKFSPPTFCANKTSPTNLIFRDKSIGKIGSFIIRNNDFSVINSGNPILPVLSTGNQLSILNPKDDGSNYILNYTSNKLFEGQITQDADSKFQTYYSAKVQSSLNISSQDRTQISIGAGNFENQLGLLYRKALNNEINPLEFNPLYYLWMVHKSGQIQNNDKIILSFDGLCFYSSKGVENGSQFRINSQLNSSGSFPFLSYGVDASAQWTSSSSFTSQTNIYNIYMFSTPTLINIPSVEDILINWNNLSNISNPIAFPNSKTIPTNSPLIIKATFGPIANKQILPLIKIDQSYSITNLTGSAFIKKIKLVNDDPKRFIDNNNGYYTFEIEIYRDEDYITTNAESINDKIQAEFPLRVYIDNPIQGKYLEKIYDKIQLETERYPTPYFNEYQISPTKETNTNNYVYKANIRFNAPENLNISTTPKPPFIAEILGLPASIDESFKAALKNATFKPLGNNEFEIKFYLPLNSNYFNINQRSLDIAVLLKFTANNTNYNRKLPLRIVASEDQFLSSHNQITTNIILRDNGELINSLNPISKLKNGKSIAELMAMYKTGENLDILSFIEEFKKESNLTITPDNTYSLSPEYIDIKKLNK